ncbi:MAG: LytTR family transcriptional regulator [Saprospiraceae bacterium]|nr:LytTR family transcriptional regulator [Candidatus Opimibacter skivensis]MBP8085891.1 LytTR family transcriptional regulator [Saprospiraceae bacterium]
MQREPVTNHPLIFSLRERNPDHKRTGPLFMASNNSVYQDPFVSMCQKGKIEFILVKDIVFVKAESNYIRIHTLQGNCIMLAKTLKQVFSKLGYLGFVRVHQSYLVHPQHIQCYNKSDGTLLLHNRKEIPVSRSHRRFVSESLSAWAL